MSEKTVLAARSIVKRFGAVTALDGVSFDLRAGEIHALCGENGAGKSTLIKLLSGVHPHGSYDGEILVDGLPAEFRSTRDAERAGIAIIHQELALFPDMTVGENLFLGAFPRRLGRIDWDRVYAQSAATLADCGIQLDPATRVGDLGIGQQQLVEIARAIARKPKVLVLDEPTAALSRSEIDTLLAQLRQLRERGVACVFISHKLDEVFAIADRITVLRDGSAQGTLDAAGTDADEVIRRMVGRRIEDHYPRRQSAPGRTLLALRSVNVDPPNDGGIALRGIDLEVRAGEVLGIGGLMGAGRTELLMHLMGLWGKRRAGTVELDGQAFAANDPRAALARGLAIVTEDRKRYGLVLPQGVTFNVSLSSLAEPASRCLHRSRRRGRSHQDDRRRPADQGTDARAAGRHAVGRQPAESGPRQDAADATQGPAARRADARHRRRRQARGVRTHQPADVGRPGHRARIQRTRRAAGHERSHRDALRRPRRRNVRARGSDAGIAAGCRDGSPGARGMNRFATRELSMLVALVAIWAFFAWQEPVFLSARNLSLLSVELAVTAVLALGMLVVLLPGQIDLSAGSGVGLAGAVAAVLVFWHDVPAPVAILIATIGAVLVWSAMGALIAIERIPAFIMTLGGLLVFRGLHWLVIQNQTVPVVEGGSQNVYSRLTTYYLPDVAGYVLAGLAVAAIVASALNARKRRQSYGFPVDDGELTFLKLFVLAQLVFLVVIVTNGYRGVPIALVILGLVAVLVHQLVTNTPFGRYLYAIGGNEEAAAVSGVPVRNTIIGAYAIMGGIVALTGFMQTAYSGASTSTVGSLMELDAVAACVIGGTSLRGGRGTVLGVLFGALIMASLLNGMTLMAVSPEAKYIARGVVLALAVWLDLRLGKSR